MGREIVLFSSEEKSDRQRVCAFLRDLADKIEQNAVVLRKNGEEIAVDIPDNVELEIKYEREEGKSGVDFSLEVEIEWPEGGKGGGRVSLG